MNEIWNRDPLRYAMRAQRERQVASHQRRRQARAVGDAEASSQQRIVREIRQRVAQSLIPRSASTGSPPVATIRSEVILGGKPLE